MYSTITSNVLRVVVVDDEVEERRAVDVQVLRGVGAGAVHLHPAGQRLRPEHHVPVHRDAVRVVQRVERQQRLRQNGNIQVNTGRMGIQVNTGK